MKTPKSSRTSLALVLLFLLFPHGSNAALYFEHEVESLTKKLEVNQRSIKQLNLQLDAINITSTNFELLARHKQEILIEQRNDILRQISNLKEKNDAISASLNYFNAKKAVLPLKYSGEFCEIYYQNAPLEVRTIDAEFGNVLKTMSKLLEPTFFNYPQKITSIFLYSNEDDFKKYEVNSNALESPFLQSRYFCEYGGIQERSGSGMTLVLSMATGTRALHQLRHTLVHLCLIKQLAPNKLWSKTSVGKANYVLDEGMAEFAAEQLEAIPDQNIQLLKRSDAIEVSPVLSETILSDAEYNKASSPKVTERFAEAALFVRWLGSLPQGAGLFRQLIAADSNQYEYLLKSNQMARGVPQNGFIEYLTWRNDQLPRSDTTPPAKAPHSAL